MLSPCHQIVNTVMPLRHHCVNSVVTVDFLGSHRLSAAECWMLLYFNDILSINPGVALGA